MTTTYGFGFDDLARPRSRGARIARIDALATLLDTALVIPGTGMRLRYVTEHARDDVARRAKLVGLVHDEQRQRRGDDVADDGKEPDQRIQAEAHAGARNDERGSSRVASASIRATRAPRERGRAKSSKSKP